MRLALRDLDPARFAQSIRIDADGFLPEDDYFHMEPGETRTVHLAADGAARALRGTVDALNGAGPVPIVVAERRA